MLIGTHVYDGDTGSNRRQRSATEALIRLPEVQAVNVQFRHGETCAVPHLESLFVLEHDSASVTRAAVRRKPLTREMFDTLATVAEARGLDYFGYFNSDIVVTPRLLEIIRKCGRDAYAISRADVDVLTDPQERPVLLTAGQDGFVVRVAWWRRHASRFRPYIVGEMCWDVVYTAILMCHSNGLLLNRDPLVLHERHAVGWQTDSPAARYNGMLAALDARYFSIWCAYWDALEACRQRGASARRGVPAPLEPCTDTADQEARLRDDVFVWRRSPLAAARQMGRSAKARRAFRRHQRGWRAAASRGQWR